MRKIKVSQATASLHMNRFKSGASAIFPFHQSKLHHFTVPANIQNYSIETLVGSQLPQQIFIAFVDEDEESFSGKQSLNPYHFKNFNLTSFVFKVFHFITLYLKFAGFFSKSFFILG